MATSGTGSMPKWAAMSAALALTVCNRDISRSNAFDSSLVLPWNI
jgi:hypothetical protein